VDISKEIQAILQPWDHMENNGRFDVTETISLL